MMRQFPALILVLILTPSFVRAATLDNVSIIPGNIWYSKYPLQNDVPVLVYTAIFNGSDQEVQGSVTFRDNDAFIADAPFLIDAGKLQEVSIAWTPRQGKHKVSAIIKEAAIVSQGNAPAPVQLVTVVTGSNTVQVAPAPPSLASAEATSFPANAGISAVSEFTRAANSTLAGATNALAKVLPVTIKQPVQGVTGTVNNFVSQAAQKVTAQREAVRADLAALQARDNQDALLAKGSARTFLLSQQSAVAPFAPVRWLKSFYDSITGALTSWVLGDLPHRVTAARDSTFSGARKPFEYLWFFFLSIVAFVLTNLWLFWILFLFSSFYLFRFFYRKIFLRNAYY